MKKLGIYIIIAVAALFIYSCEDDKDIATLTPGAGVPSSLITPEDASAFVLAANEADENFETFAWTESDYGPALSRSYSLEMDLTGTSFEKSIRLIKTVDLSYTATNAQINLMLYDAGVTSAVDASFRIMTTVKDKNVDTLISAINKVSITPYAYTKANLTAPAEGSKHVLLEKNAEKDFDAFVWDAVYYGADFSTLYSIEIDKEGNNFAKPVVLVSKLTTTSYVGTVEDINNALIKLDEEAGVAKNYEIRIVSAAANKSGVVYGDAITMKFTSYGDEPVDPGEPGDYPENLHLVGDATDVGWDAATAIPMVNDGGGKYSLITNLKADEGLEGYKFLVFQGKWAPMYAQDGEGTWDAGNLAFRETEADADPKAIPHPEVTGSYLIEVDLEAMTYSVTAQ